MSMKGIHVLKGLINISRLLFIKRATPKKSTMIMKATKTVAVCNVVV
ncbi:hypothetical protein KAI23_02400 [Candidatus Bathyarchaeota archaeon]|nr:hypothetical protein [Candidatus Bathyarchaeota archaeon]